MEGQSNQTDVKGANRRKTRKTCRKLKSHGMAITILLTSAINGYDVSNVASLQPRLYAAFGSIEILPWVGLSYSLALFSSLSLARKVIYLADMRHVYLGGLITFIAGAGTAGAAPNMAAVIVGRSIMGIGGAVVQQCNMSYLTNTAVTQQAPALFARMSAMWAVGVVVGAPIGSAFVANPTLTWRWALYINIPFVGLGLAIAAFCAPSHVFSTDHMRARLYGLDPVGILLNMFTPSLFALALTLSGPVWAWGSGASISVWVAFGVCFFMWVVQQCFCLFTNRQDRAMPLHILSRRDLQPLWIASACAGSTYAVTLYYTPLFFAFARGFGPLEQTVRFLPFILVFILIVLLTGAVLPRVGRRYGLVYIAAGVITLSAGVTIAITLREDVSDVQVMALCAVIGCGLGLHFQSAGIIHSVNEAFHNRPTAMASSDQLRRDQFDSITVLNFAQMGGIAVTLAAASAVFENVGYNSLVNAIGDTEYSSHQVREALAGVSSSFWKSAEPAVLERSLEAVTRVIAKEFYIVAASAAFCLVCGLIMTTDPHI